MKKAILTSGLFALMLILTSFTAPIGNQGVPRTPANLGYAEIGNQGVPRTPANLGYAEIGNQGVPRTPANLGYSN